MFCQKMKFTYLLNPETVIFPISKKIVFIIASAETEYDWLIRGQVTLDNAMYPQDNK